MGTAHLFSYNLSTNGIITGCTQFGNMAVSLNTTDTAGFTVNNMGNPYHGPDEDLGYVIAYASPSGTRTHKRGSQLAPNAVGFVRSLAKTDASFVELVNKNFNQSFSLNSSGALTAKNYLTTNGCWTSWLAPIVTSGLIMNLDAGSTASYPGSGNIWYDLSGNGYNGTLTNGPAYNSSNGGSIVLDGTNDYINGASISSQLTGDITVEVWVKISTSPSDWVRVIGTGANPSGNRTFGLWFATNRTVLWQRYISSSGSVGIQPSDVLVTGNWYNIAATTSGNSHAVYINGVSVGTSTANGPWGASNESITLGSAVGIHAYLAGNMAVSRIYNRGLSSNEVQQNYNAIKSRFGL
jgi:hypothetical protein